LEISRRCGRHGQVAHPKSLFLVKPVNFRISHVFLISLGRMRRAAERTDDDVFPGRHFPEYLDDLKGPG